MSDKPEFIETAEARSERRKARMLAAEVRQNAMHTAHIAAWKAYLVANAESYVTDFIAKVGGTGAAATSRVEPERKIRVEERIVPNPRLMEPSYVFELEPTPEDIARGRLGKPQPKTIKATVNMGTLLGGYARIHGTTEAMKLAVAKYRSLYERADVSSARAQDYEAVKVDTSGSGNNSMSDHAADAMQELIRASRALGDGPAALVEKCAIGDMSVHQLSRLYENGVGGAARERVKNRLLEAAGRLAEHFQFAGTAPAKAKPRAWDDGSDQFYAGPSTTRKVAA